MPTSADQLRPPGTFRPHEVKGTNIRCLGLAKIDPNDFQISSTDPEILG